MWTVGKSPLFELRRVDDEASSSLKPSLSTQKDPVQDSKLVNSQSEKVGTTSDDEGVDYYRKSSKLNNDRYLPQRSSPVCVYTFKVNVAVFNPLGPFIFQFQMILLR